MEKGILFHVSGSLANTIFTSCLSVKILSTMTSICFPVDRDE
eukprot:CAMPEP_0170628312 /NCGR_PEP_ID=MMETSP0224-20130122/32597_1 /TAXON_ID=285029 /ORGANISM="Togula jolla, Strain CCCM 725" /LENGTH=41 /DNA_ID= /DNA_START= /DNA_END= /DNA_ORIENTATION=